MASSTNEIVTNGAAISAIVRRSRQTVRSVLDGKAVGSYLGKVEVARGAQQTDGEQSVKAMLLDRGATANCKPELEIYADDVKCAHGASVGELDAMQLFYAQAAVSTPQAPARCFSKASSWACGMACPTTAKRDAICNAAARCVAEGRDERRSPHQLRARTCVASSRRSASWHYLDSAATAQKPQAVIDAITQAYSRDYATVHRGVYQRSATMTGRLRGGARLRLRT